MGLKEKAVPSSTEQGKGPGLLTRRMARGIKHREMTVRASIEIIRPVICSVKEQGRRAPAQLARTVHSISRRSALRFSVAMATSPIIDAFVKGTSFSLMHLWHAGEPLMKTLAERSAAFCPCKAVLEPYDHGFYFMLCTGDPQKGERGDCECSPTALSRL